MITAALYVCECVFMHEGDFWVTNLRISKGLFMSSCNVGSLLMYPNLHLKTSSVFFNLIRPFHMTFVSIPPMLNSIALYRRWSLQTTSCVLRSKVATRQSLISMWNVKGMLWHLVNNYYIIYTLHILCKLIHGQKHPFVTLSAMLFMWKPKPCMVLVRKGGIKPWCSCERAIAQFFFWLVSVEQSHKEFQISFKASQWSTKSTQTWHTQTLIHTQLLSATQQSQRRFWQKAALQPP